MPITKIILVGGFLGAGKTTLLAQAAVRLTARGKRVGLVANDQAADLVDTELLKQSGASVAEVAGGCFCCRFSDMIEAMQRLARESGADVLIGEPVGSCTDLSATVLQPLKQLHRHQFHVAPFSVLVDGNQVRVLAKLRREAAESPAAAFPDNVLYIYEKQLEEADLIVLNKTDRLPEGELAELKASLAERFPQTPVLPMSALTGEGVEQWLDFVLQDLPVGNKIAEVDYDTYAAGEAALGWMNASAKLVAKTAVDWRTFASELLEAIRAKLDGASAQIAHLKLFLTTARGHLVGNVTSNQSPLSIRGEIGNGTPEASLLINARVHTHPNLLQNIVEQCLQTVAGGRIDVEITNVRAFFPGRPEPTHRFKSVVEN
jgi:G3E family GTPase